MPQYPAEHETDDSLRLLGLSFVAAVAVLVVERKEEDSISVYTSDPNTSAPGPITGALEL